MKKIKVRAHLTIGYSGSNREEVIDVEIPDTLDEENREDWIEDEVQHWANNHISITWEEL